MVRYLQRLRRKKGFTLIELVVVISVIAVLMIVVVSNINNNGQKIKAYNTYAQDFYLTMQSTFTRYSTFAGDLSPAMKGTAATPTTPAVSPSPYMEYIIADRGNFPKADLWVEVCVEANKVKYANVAKSLPDLILYMDETNTDEFARLLKLEIEDKISYQDGYYYAHVVKGSPVVVEYAAYKRYRIDVNTSSGYIFSNKTYILNNGEVCGVCSISPGSVSGGSFSNIKMGFEGSNLAA